MIVVFPSKKRRSKVNGGSRWVYSKPVTDMAGVRRIRQYIMNLDHEDHQGATISSPRIWGARSSGEFDSWIERQHIAFLKLPKALKGNRWNKEIAEHVVFSFPKGVVLADFEKEAFEKNLKKHFGRGSVGFLAWHEDSKGDKCVHLHVLLSCFTPGAFPSLRVRETRALAPGRDYLAQVCRIARQGVELVNQCRLKMNPVADLVPTLSQVREVKRKKENEARKKKGEPKRLRFVDSLWLALGRFFDEEEDDEAFRERCRKATSEKMRWKILRETKGAMTVLPPGSKRKQGYRMPFENLRSQFHRMFRERNKSKSEKDSGRSLPIGLDR